MSDGAHTRRGEAGVGGIIMTVVEKMHSLVWRRPGWIIGIALIFALWGYYLYQFNLPILSDRGRLSNQNSELNRRYASYEKAFGGDNRFLVLVVSAGLPEEGLPKVPDADQKAAMKRLAANFAKQLRARHDLFPRVIERIDPAKMGDLASLYQAYPAFNATIDEAGRILPLVLSFGRSPTFSSLFGGIDKAFGLLNPADTLRGRRRHLTGLISGMTTYLKMLSDALDGRNESTLHSPVNSMTGFENGTETGGYFFSPNGRILTVMANVEGDAKRRNRYGPALAYAWKAAHRAEASVDGEVYAGLAGMPALEYEENRTSQRDFARGTLMALVLVSGLFMWGFGSALRPALAAVCLGLSIGITFGAAWLILGHLNMLAMVFAIILVALGVDFSIHFYTHYRQARSVGMDPTNAIEYTYRTIGGALWMGGLTTAGAFLTAWFTPAPGLAELGLVAGTGLLICLLCMYFVFPAMLFLVDSRLPTSKRRFAIKHVAGNRSIKPTMWIPILATILAVSGFLIGQYSFDTNLLHLQSVEGAAGQWQKLLLRTGDRTAFTLSTFPDRKSLEAMRTNLEASPLVRRTESVFPDHETARRGALAPLCASLSGLIVGPDTPPNSRTMRRAIFGFRQTLRKIARSSPNSGDRLAPLIMAVEGLYLRLSSIRSADAADRLAPFQSDLRTGFLTSMVSAKRYACPPPFKIHDAPKPLRERFVGDHGTLALEIYPAVNTWDTHELARFVTGVRRIDPQVFGGVVNFYENARVMIASFVRAALYAALAVLILLLLWTRSWRKTMLSLLPLLIGIGFLLGCMKLVPGFPRWNFANFFAVPILIGAGVDAGIHMVQAWQDDAAYAGAVRAVMLSGITTLIGFGVLATSNHRGIASLGLILFLGISFHLLAALVVLPRVLAILETKEQRK